MNKYWKRNVNLAEIMLDIGRHRGHKDDTKLLQCVNKLKLKYNSLRQACHLADISWTKFHHLTYVKPKSRGKKDYILNNQKMILPSYKKNIMFSDLISFPLSDKKYQGKPFMRFNVHRSARMYNLWIALEEKFQLQPIIDTSPRL